MTVTEGRPITAILPDGLPLHLAWASGEQRFREADPSLVADQNLLSRITFDPAKCGGRPCIRHYRLRVSDVLDTLAGGASVAEVLADYPFLEADDIRACLAYASSQIGHPVLTGSA